MSCPDGKFSVRIKAHTQCRAKSTRKGSRKKTQAKTPRQKQRASKRTGPAPRKSIADMTDDELLEAKDKKLISGSAYFKEAERRGRARQAGRKKSFDSMIDRLERRGRMADLKERVRKGRKLTRRIRKGMDRT